MDGMPVPRWLPSELVLEAVEDWRARGNTIDMHLPTGTFKRAVRRWQVQGWARTDAVDKFLCEIDEPYRLEWMIQRYERDPLGWGLNPDQRNSERLNGVRWGAAA